MDMRRVTPKPITFCKLELMRGSESAGVAPADPVREFAQICSSNSPKRYEDRELWEQRFRRAELCVAILFGTIDSRRTGVYI